MSLLKIESFVFAPLRAISCRNDLEFTNYSGAECMESVIFGEKYKGRIS